MTIITQDVSDIAGADDNTSWTFYTKYIRVSDAGNTIISTKKVRKYPVAGVLTVVLDPGRAVVTAPDGNSYPFTVPATNSALWPLIQAAVTIPPSTTHQQLLDAVNAWMDAHLGAADEYHEYANFAAFPGTGVADRIYVDISTTPATLYRWTGSVYAVEGSGGGGTPTDGSVTFPKLAVAAVVTASETIAANNNDTTIPTSAAVQAAITAAVTALLNGAPGALDTLKELADAINDDASFAASITTALAGKQPLDSDLTTLAGLTATTDSFIQSKSGAWSARTIAQVKTDLSLSGTNTGDITVTDNTDGTVTVGAVTAMETLPVAAAVITANTAPAIGKTTYYNATGGSLAPPMPALSGLNVGARLAVRRDPVDVSANTITFALAGGDTFYSSGSTSFTLPISGEQREYQVIQPAATKYWAPVGSLNPVSGLDLRYQPLDSDLTNIAALSTQAFGRSLLTQPDAAGIRAAIGATSTVPVSISEESIALPVVTTASTVGTSEQILPISVAASGLYVEFIHWKNDETDPATTITFNASIRIGSTIYRLTFGGRTTATLDPGGRIRSDKIGASVAVGDIVAVRTFLASGTAYSPRLLLGAFAGKGGFTAATDLTAPGSAAPAVSFNGYTFGPAAITAQVDVGAKSVLLLGDSILRGYGDGLCGSIAGQILAAPQYGMGGFVVRALAGAAGVIQASRVNDLASTAASNASLRRLGLVDRCFSGIVELGINDLVAGRTPAQLQGDLLTIIKNLRRQGLRKVFLTTITPSTASTDGWATTANQTAFANNANRVTHNNWVRGGCPVDSTTLAPVAVGTGGALLAGSVGHPVTGYFEVADRVESARDSGKWKAARRTVSTGAMTNGLTTLTAAGAAWVNSLITVGGDIGTTINVMGAGTAGALLTTFADFYTSSTVMDTIDPASTTVSGALVVIGPATCDGIHPSSDAHLLMSAAIDVTQL